MRAALLVDAAPERVLAAAVSVRTWVRAAAACGLRMSVVAGPAGAPRPASHRRTARVDVDGRDLPTGALECGDVLSWLGRPGRAVRMQVDTVGGSTVLVRLVGVARHSGWSVTVTAASTLAGSLVTVDVRPGAGRRLPRTRVLRGAQVLLGVILLAATQPGPGRDELPGGVPTSAWLRATDAGPRRVVVAGVVVRDGAILAARRTQPPELAGRWECPGGKVEPGESETVAVARELAEELGIVVAVGGRVGPEIDIDGRYLLRAYRAEITAGHPSPSVHDAVRWVGAGEIDALAWLPSDAPLIPALRLLLEEGATNHGHSSPSADR